MISTVRKIPVQLENVLLCKMFPACAESVAIPDWLPCAQLRPNSRFFFSSRTCRRLPHYGSLLAIWSKNYKVYSYSSSLNFFFMLDILKEADIAKKDPWFTYHVAIQLSDEHFFEVQCIKNPLQCYKSIKVLIAADSCKICNLN